MNWKYIFIIISFSLKAQTEKENNYILKGNGLHENKSYVDAEAEFRKALSINQDNPIANQNLGNTLYRSEDYDQANQRFFRSQKDNLDKNQKHLAFHNMGNVFMKKKDYPKAVEAYKNALRNNPKDDETRYNYALAKKFLEGDKRQNSQNSDDSEEEKKDKSEDQRENKDEDQNSDQDSNSEKEKPKDQEEDKNQEEGGGLSKQQMENLLDAVNNIEKDLNQKIKSGKKKVKTSKKTEKDW